MDGDGISAMNWRCRGCERDASVAESCLFGTDVSQGDRNVLEIMHEGGLIKREMLS